MLHVIYKENRQDRERHLHVLRGLRQSSAYYFSLPQIGNGETKNVWCDKYNFTCKINGGKNGSGLRQLGGNKETSKGYTQYEREERDIRIDKKVVRNRNKHEEHLAPRINVFEDYTGCWG